MAGGKETPRQKMIGMMYLVLTALLALNVSNAVLEKFAIIVGVADIRSTSGREPFPPRSPSALRRQLD